MFTFKQKYNAATKTLELRDAEINFLIKERDKLRMDLLEKEKELKEARKIIDQYRTLSDATPADCKRGSWCKACEFVKPMRTYTGLVFREDYFCGKAGACSNFVQKVH